MDALNLKGMPISYKWAPLKSTKKTFIVMKFDLFLL